MFNPAICSRLKAHLSLRASTPSILILRNFSKIDDGTRMPPKVAPHPKLITVENMNPNIRIMKYAVRGPIVKRALEIEALIAANEIEKTYKYIIKANVGDAHAMGQKPLTYIRQVLASVCYPALMDQLNFNSDVKEKALTLLAACSGTSVGAYSDSAGIPLIRQHVASFITKRDGGVLSRESDIFLSAGASEGIRTILKLFQDGRTGKHTPAVMCPIPLYPLYSATLAEYKIHLVPYYLNEGKNWGLDLPDLERAISFSKTEFNTRAIVVINPGNPTGQVFTKKNIQDIIKFAYREKLVILADEVYQDNIYDTNEFFSFKKVMMEMGEPYSYMELASFYSSSKGFAGECGLRAGYTEIVNFEQRVKDMILKCISAKLCPTILGQVALDCIVDKPGPDHPSYKSFFEEKAAVLSALAEKAKILNEGLNAIPGISCNPVQGAMYGFPKIEIPQKAIDAGVKKGFIEPDEFYAFELLESKGMLVVPGSGFGQLPGTYHFRTTILPSKDKLEEMIHIFGEFQSEFLAKYG